MSFEEQVKHAQNEHNLKVVDLNKAIQIFKTYSYYDLINGYIKSLASDISGSRFADFVTLDLLLDIFMCDREIQGALFTHSVHCETKFKNIMANVIAEQYGVHQNHYLNRHNYKPRSRKINTDRLLDRISDNYKTEKQKGKIKGNKKDIDYVDNPTKHYRDKHNHIPPWILFKNTHFNDVIDLYQVLLGKDKIAVTKHITDVTTLNNFELQELILTSITGIRQFRNTIAHNQKFITHRIKRDVKPTQIEKSRAGDLGVWKHQDNYDNNKVKGILFYICSLINILDNDRAVTTFIIALIQAIMSCEVKYGPDVVKLYYDITGLPSDLVQRLEKALDVLS